MIGNICYISSFALQISGALLLVIEWCMKTEKILEREYFQKGIYLAKEEKGEVEISTDTSTIENILNHVYTNKFAFTYVFGGYILTVFSITPYNKKVAVVFIVCVTCVLIGITKKIIRKMASKNCGTDYYKMVIKASVPEGTVIFVEDPEDKE